MTTQSEAALENKMIQQLVELGYESVKVQDGDALVRNLKSKLEAFNKDTYSDNG
jgi:type I restriction enzyme R subunit